MEAGGFPSFVQEQSCLHWLHWLHWLAAIILKKRNTINLDTETPAIDSKISVVVP